MTGTTSRLLDLLSLLQARRDWPGSLLAERLGISARTVRRDVDRLRAMGYNINASMGPDGGYRLEAGSELPPLLFDDEQAIALAISLHAAAVTGVGIEEAATRALTTVRQVLPQRLRHRLDTMEFTTVASRPGGGSPPVSPEVLIAVSTAVRTAHVLRFDYVTHSFDTHGSDYRSSDTTPEPPSPRRVEPHHLVMSHGSWYLVGWDLDHDQWRIFRADRMTPRMPSGPRFVRREIPGGDPEQYVAARFKGSELVDRWPCIGKVVLHRPAGHVRPFAGDGIVEDLGTGRCTLELGSWSWVALAASLNLFDTDIDVLYPPQLTDAFAQLAARNSATAHR